MNMLYVLGLCFLLITILGSRYYTVLFSKKINNNIIESIELIICFAFLIIYRGGLIDIPDYDIYKGLYELDLFTKDIGFGVLTYIIKLTGANLNYYRLICGVIGLVFIYLTTSKYLNKKGILLFLLLYFLYPYFLDCIQIRNYIAMAIFCYAFTFLVDDNKKSKLFYLMLALLAASMQKTVLFFIPFIIFYKSDKNKIIRTVLIVCVAIALLIGLNKDLLSDIALFFLNSLSILLKGLDEYAHVKTRYGWMFFWLISLINLFIIWLINNEYNKKNIENRLVKTVFLLNIYTLIALPLFVMDTNFFRIGRDIQPLNMLAIAFYVNDIRQNKMSLEKRKYIIFWMIVIIAILFMVYVTIYREDLLKYFVTGFSDSWIF